jgi:hypothetical protein
MKTPERSTPSARSAGNRQRARCRHVYMKPGVEHATCGSLGKFGTPCTIRWPRNEEPLFSATMGSFRLPVICRGFAAPHSMPARSANRSWEPRSGAVVSV